MERAFPLIGVFGSLTAFGAHGVGSATAYTGTCRSMRTDPQKHCKP
jgi:hypothetical protein